MANDQVTMTLSADEAETTEEIEDALRTFAEEQGWRLASVNAVEVA